MADQTVEQLKEVNASLVLLISEFRRPPTDSPTLLEVAEVVKDIHLLVNSERTAAFERELAATKRELMLLTELGRPITVIKATEAAVQKLEETLAERSAAQAKIDGRS